MGRTRESRASQSLYGLWEKIKKSGEPVLWTDFGRFYDWAEAVGYEPGQYLTRMDASLPWGPTNCLFRNAPPLSPEIQKRIREWNRVVNVIRAAYGLPLFEVEEK